MGTFGVGILAKAILSEYAWVLGLIVLYFVLLAIVLIAVSKSKGNTGLGIAVIYAYVRLALFTVAGLFVCVFNPALTLVRRHKEIEAIQSLPARIGLFILILFPIVLYVGFIIVAFFGNMIDSYFYHKKYEVGKDSFTPDPVQYKSAADFRAELTARGLYADEASGQLLERLNKPYEIPLHCNRFFYEKASIFALDKGKFEDNKDTNRWMSGTSTEKHPLFLYNAILTLPEGETDLRYAPVAHYVRNTRPHGYKGDVPALRDYYVECKILYVNGEVYAMIGVGESRAVSDCFPKDRPYYLILSERDEITTFYEGKYCPHGAIKNQCDGTWEMHPNTNMFDKNPPYPPANYPVRKVERVDREAVNRVAAELQQGILKESVTKWWDRAL